MMQSHGFISGLRGFRDQGLKVMGMESDIGVGDCDQR